MTPRRTGADLFEGTEHINELYRKVGAIVTSLGGVEETLRFLEWNLLAFELAANMPSGTSGNDVVLALQSPKATYLSQRKPLFMILAGIGSGFAGSQRRRSCRAPRRALAAAGAGARDLARGRPPRGALPVGRCPGRRRGAGAARGGRGVAGGGGHGADPARPAPEALGGEPAARPSGLANWRK